MNDGGKVFEKMSKTPVIVGKPGGQFEVRNKTGDVKGSGKSWSQVVKNAPVATDKVAFKFIPLAEGSDIVSPPDEVLKRGNDKFKNTIVGTFTKGTVPFTKVCEFARNMWEKSGLVHVGQKDNNTFFFRFDNVQTLQSAISQGTWYVLNRPMLVHAWGTSAGSVKSIPIWVQLEQIPDCYWTLEGLSSIVSAIGLPICADHLTNQLEILPFAKLCVMYDVGKELPSSINVSVLDPNTNAKSVEIVKVSYLNRPHICSACNSIGHLVGACPRATRKWV